MFIYFVFFVVLRHASSTTLTKTVVLINIFMKTMMHFSRIL